MPSVPEPRVAPHCCPRCAFAATIVSPETAVALPCASCGYALRAWSTPEGWHVFGKEAAAPTLAATAQKLAIAPDKFTPADGFADLGADSLDVAEIIMEVEGRLGVNLPSDEADAVRTVGDLVRVVDRCLLRKDDSSGNGSRA